MRTAVTIIKTKQTGMDNFKDVHVSKVFDDIHTLGDVKKWICLQFNNPNLHEEDVSLASVTFSDVDDE